MPSSSAAVPSPLVLSADSNTVRSFVRNIGWALIGVQLIGLLVWSAHVASRDAMSWDFAAYFQPWWAIAHGHLNPAATVMPGGYPFWRNDGEFIVWLLAPLYWLFPNHEVGFWWIQDVALAGITAVCYRWIGELLPWDTSLPAKENVIPAVGWMLAVLLLVLNPWIYWSATFAVQMEPFGVFFAILALRSLLSGHRGLWAWCVLAALCGSASVVYVVSVGITGLVACLWGRRQQDRAESASPFRWSVTDLRVPLAIIVGGVVWLLALSALHATESFSNPAISVHQDLAYLNGAHSSGKLLLARTALHAATHPGAVLSVIGSHGLNLWANTAPPGLVGLLSIPGFFMSAPTLLENSILKGQDFSYPGFASLIVYVAIAIGTALVVTALMRRRRTLGLALAALVVLNAIAWCVAWLPKAGSEYVSIDAPAAQTLSSAAAKIPAGSEVIASQGFVGRFAAHHNVQVFGGPSSKLAGPEVFPVDGRDVWFVISANEGIEVPSTSATDAAVSSVAALPGVRLVDRSNGVWVFDWHAPATAHSVSLGGPRTPVPGWSTAGTSARLVLNGTPDTWKLESDGTQGYVVSGDIWRLPAGSYTARVLLASTRPSNVEIWNDGHRTDTLLARRSFSSKPVRQLSVRFSVPAPEPAPSSTGSAPLAFTPEPPAHASNVEVRVWTPGKGVVRVNRVAVTPN